MGALKCCLIPLVVAFISSFGSNVHARNTLDVMAVHLNSSFNGGFKPIAASEECKQDVETLCERHRDSDWTTIDCLQQNEETLNAVSSQCQHFIWERKHALTQKSAFESSIPNRCIQHFDFPECRPLVESSYYVPCLVEYKNLVKESVCKVYLNRVAAFIFSDYRLVYHLIDSCSDDIKQWQCGRLTVGPSSPAEELSHLTVKSQGATIHCLRNRIEKLKPECRVQLFRVTELQADDYHLDRPLYYACREDRERLCGNVDAGDGMVYACLKENKYHHHMSPDCRKMISERQRLRSVDYSVDFRLSKACATDLSGTQCGIGLPRSDLHLSQIMLCLEAIEQPQMNNTGINELAKPRHLKPECRAQLEQLRRELLDDYRLSPDLLSYCDRTIEQHCAHQKHGRGNVLHCLLHQLRLYTVERPPKQCERALYSLIKLTNVQENVILDPVIDRACHSLLTGKCAGSHTTGYSMLFECLSSHATDPEMTSSCARHLDELNYFIIRDVFLDDQLHSACAEDSLKMCDMPNRKWSDQSQLDGHLLICLYNHRHHRPTSAPTTVAVLSKHCEVEVMRVMHMRAASVSLEPRVFEVCLADLAACDEEEEEEVDDDDDDLLDYPEAYLDEKTVVKVEKKKNSHGDRSMKLTGMNCLQQRLQTLRPECRAAVIEVSAEAEDDANLDKLISEACVAAETRFCAAHEEPGQVLHCLIRHKNHLQMEEACRAAVEHMQIIASKDLQLSPTFHRNCRTDAERYCKSQIPYGTSAVIVCLSTQLTAARIFKSQSLNEADQQARELSPFVSPLIPACHEELVNQLYERSETILLDPELAGACEADRKRFCSDLTPGNARVLTCLRDHRDELTADCHTHLFVRDKLMAVENMVDYSLLASCSQMITFHCSPVLDQLTKTDGLELDKQIGHHSIVTCLTNALSHESTSGSFDKTCRKQIWSVLLLRAKDYRLNPELVETCGRDIATFCFMEADNTRMKKYESNGPVLHCLKKRFIEKEDINRMLHHKCQSYVRLLLKWESAVYHLDPVLTGACRADVIKYCSHRLPSSNKLGRSGDVADEQLDEDKVQAIDQNVRECLQETLQQNKLNSRECAQEVMLMIEEVKSDLHVDPVLYQACALEVQELCGEIEPGNGRQVTCLLHILDRPDASSALGRLCLIQLTKRRDLWNNVAKLQRPDSLKRVIEQVRASPSRNNVLIALFIIVTIIFIFGLCCGRVTKRVPIDVKSR